MAVAVVGDALVPLLQGWIADSPIGLHYAFFLPVICYAFISLFGLTRGHAVGTHINSHLANYLGRVEGSHARPRRCERVRGESG